MHCLEIPIGMEWELLIVNNNCNDNTDEIIGRHADRLPIRRLFEPKPGKSNALNLAAAEAKGELILWTDDDVLVDRSWLAGYAAAACQWPDAVFFGGPIEPWFDGEPPAWLSRTWVRVSFAFAVRNLGDQPVELTRELRLRANFAIRTATQVNYRYDSAIGPRPGSSLRGEEVELIGRLFDDNLAGRWVPDAQVRHFIPKRRQTLRYIREYFIGQGEYYARLGAVPDVPMMCGRPRWLFRALLEGEATFRIGRLLFPPRVWIDGLIRSANAWGQLRAWPKYGQVPRGRRQDASSESWNQP